jgi:hypothetical protein
VTKNTPNFPPKLTVNQVVKIFDNYSRKDLDVVFLLLKNCPYFVRFLDVLYFIFDSNLESVAQWLNSPLEPILGLTPMEYLLDDPEENLPLLMRYMNRYYGSEMMGS